MAPSYSKTHTVFIAVAGGSGSGKSTFVDMLTRELGEEHCVVIRQDHYCIDQSERFDGDGGSVNFDHPSAYEFSLLSQHLQLLSQGQVVESPIYDFCKHRRLVKTQILQPRPFVIVDGILILHPEEMQRHFDFSFYISSPEEIRLARRLQRDTEERGRKKAGVIRQFHRQVKPMHDAYVEPCLKRCHAMIESRSMKDFEDALVKYIPRLKIRHDGAAEVITNSR